MRGPLDVLKESWEVGNKENESVVSYVLLMRERLNKMTELVQTTLGKAVECQKYWYDRTARSRKFAPGDEVLVLLPTSTKKLLAQWQGPYPVTRKVGKVDYEVDMKDKSKRRRVFHINMLKPFHTPEAVVCFAGEECEGRQDDIPVWNGEPSGAPITGDHLSELQKQQLQTVLHRYERVLQAEPGTTSLTEHVITVQEGKPFRQAPYHIPQAYKETVKQELNKMLQAGIITTSSSAWALPIVLVNKKDGSLRLCVDYRKLNSVAQMDAYPMPCIDKLIDQLGKARYLSTLDLARGYWQVPVASESQPLTAFITPFGLYQFKVMPFGLSGAPATFQRLINKLLQGMWEYAAAHLDDLVIYSCTWEEHLALLQEVLMRLYRAGLTANPRKCQFGMAQCVYLGIVVGNGVIKPEISKLEAIEAFPRPPSKKQVRGFLGLTGYYRKFIANYSSLALPLTDLTRKSSPNLVEWTENCESAFQKLKGLLCKTRVLRAPDFTKEFVLQTDTSERGVGAVLGQRDDLGLDHPIAYFSRKLLPKEEKYSTVEKECLSVKLGVEAFRTYVLAGKALYS